MAVGRGPNYLRLTDEDFENSIDDIEVIETLEKLEQLMRSFATLDCTVCNHHFGYQHRQDVNVRVCSARCLSIADKKLLSTGELSSAASTLTRVINGIKKRENGSSCSLSAANSYPKRGTDSPTMVFASGMDEMIAASSKLVVRDDPAAVKPSGVKALLAKYCPESVPNVPAEIMVKGGDGAKKFLGSDVTDKVSVADAVSLMTSGGMVNDSAVPTAVKMQNGGSNMIDTSELLSITQKLVRPKPLAVKPVAKKQWTMKDMVPSLEFYDNQKVMVFFMWTSKAFTINTMADEKKRDKMQEDIQSYVSKASPASRRFDSNDIVFAAYGDEGYFRGCIIGPAGEGKYDIRFLDYGDRKTVLQRQCFEPSDEIMVSNPLYGVRFTLVTKRDDVVSLGELEGTAFEEVATTELLTIEIKEKCDDKWLGYLYRENGSSLNDLVDELTAQLQDKADPEVATSVEDASPLKSLPLKAADISPQKSLPPAETGTETGTSPPKSLIKFNPFMKPVESEVPKKPGMETLQYTPNLKDGAQVSITFVWQPSRVTVTAVDDTERLDDLATAVLDCVDKKKALTGTPDLNEIIVAKYDESYYRGRVNGIEGDKVHVSFIDYGDRASVKIADCFEADEEIMKFPIFGRVVKLVDVPEDSPNVCNDELSEAAASFLVMNVVKADPDVFSAILKLDNTRTYNQLVLKALNIL